MDTTMRPETHPLPQEKREEQRGQEEQREQGGQEEQGVKQNQQQHEGQDGQDDHHNLAYSDDQDSWDDRDSWDGRDSWDDRDSRDSQDSWDGQDSLDGQDNQVSQHGQVEQESSSPETHVLDESFWPAAKETLSNIDSPLTKTVLANCQMCFSEMNLLEHVPRGTQGEGSGHEPVMLPCGHFFGMSCLASHVHAQGSQGIPWSCPMCRATMIYKCGHPIQVQTVVSAAQCLVFADLRPVQTSLTLPEGGHLSPHCWSCTRNNFLNDLLRSGRFLGGSTDIHLCIEDGTAMILQTLQTEADIAEAFDSYDSMISSCRSLRHAGRSMTGEASEVEELETLARDAARGLAITHLKTWAFPGPSTMIAFRPIFFRDAGED